MSYKTGKLPPIFKDTDLLMRDILTPVASPSTWDWDAEHPGFSDTHVFGNDVHGDCVEAAQAHQTLCYEFVEQKKILGISDADVLKDYFRKTGGADSGLVISESLSDWRKHGWLVGGQKYTIDGYARLDLGNLDQVKAGMAADLGMHIGVAMPDNWQEAIDAGVPWTDTSLPPNPFNGHCIFMKKYEPGWFGGITWGKPQGMSEAWLAKYCDEAWVTWDSVDKLTKPTPSAFIILEAIKEWWAKHRPEPNPFL